MPSWLQAVILGVVQGLTEFIPVSSSGHLVLIPYLAGWPKPGLAFDVALHMGTFGAVAVFFRAELAAMARGLLGRGGQQDALYRRLALLVAAASVPVAILGLVFEGMVERAFASPFATALFLLITAALLLAGERRRDRRVAAAKVPAGPGGPTGPSQKPGTADLPTGADPGDPKGRDLRKVGLRDALIVGGLQCLALLPGVSRSGTTITAGVAAGLTREAATRFSFLLSLPALVGAFVLSLGDLGEPGPYSGAAIVAAIVAAFVAGYAAVRYLVALVARDRLSPFAYYCVAASLVTLVVGVLR
ncbi:MAG: undecaprenyl-diphosphate phosphatase [Actinomycetota bacterium]|jgi:undecaprenyl-diphosphatase|nr:undecaprenyl-diphosphate phosphatase [Actinomycetota bacterium]